MFQRLEIDLRVDLGVEAPVMRVILHVVVRRLEVDRLIVGRSQTAFLLQPDNRAVVTRFSQSESHIVKREFVLDLCFDSGGSISFVLDLESENLARPHHYIFIKVARLDLPCLKNACPNRLLFQNELRVACLHIRREDVDVWQWGVNYVLGPR